jgi:hypothetical protein
MAETAGKSRLADPTQVAAFFTRLAAGWITTDVETGQPLHSGQELVVKRYLPELWPEGSGVSPDALQGGRTAAIHPIPAVEAREAS